jgi:predicted CXXCH cytochrome family protein
VTARVCVGTLIAVLLMPAWTFAQVRVISPANKHNLSTTGPGPVKSTTMTEVCIFCHTPHNANPAAPLWNQVMSGATYQTYTSTTLTATILPPSGSSKLCLSCHDGTVAIGNTLNSGALTMQGVGAQGKLTGPSMLGTDLRNSHPIALVPVVGLEIVKPPVGSPVKLDTTGQLQCVSCHDPHRMDIDSTTNKFLVANNSASGLCVVCHTKQYWATNPSTHKTSPKSYTAVQGAHTGYTTVATNGCESCHKPHTALAAERGLKAPEERTCGSAGSACHGASGIGRNIEAEFVKTYRHPTYDLTPSAHDASESPTSVTFPVPETSAAAARHAECADCHNAHASYAAVTTAPKGSGKIAGVWGIDSNNLLRLPSGTPPSVNEYELCYRCHAGSANKPQPNGTFAPPYPNRGALQFDMRLMFDPGNPSFHPVEGAGKNLSVPSLIAPLTTASIIYCSDCHDNDQGPKAPAPGSGPAGPHGSTFKHLLAGRYDMDNSTQTESAVIYALCYKCHSRTTVLSTTSWVQHTRHINTASAPCSICHDPHGISSTQGTSTNNTNLINFDKRFVTPSSSGLLRFEDLGNRTGRCYLTCHGLNHNPLSY